MTEHRILLSVIISTKNRPDKIIPCVLSLLANTVKDFEIIIIDQSNKSKTKKALQPVRSANIRYATSSYKGKSAALNQGLMFAKGDIVAFTDDDCIVSTTWISNILQSFRTYPSVVGVFGNTFAYQPKKHSNQLCPSVFHSDKQSVIRKPCLHYRYIGFGNNMAFKKHIAIKIGAFRDWLGPGSIGDNAEDAEFALRSILSGYILLQNPQVKVYHDKWLNSEEMRRQLLSYTCGEMASYGYFHFQGHLFATEVIRNNIHDSVYKIKNILKNILFLEWNKKLVQDIYYTSIETIYRLRGLSVGLIYAHINPLD